MLDTVRRIGAEYGKTDLDDSLCEAIIWAETSFPFNLTGSDDLAVIQNKFEGELRDFFSSGTNIGQRQDELIEKLRAEGKWP